MPYSALVRYRQAHPSYATAFAQILSKPVNEGL